MILLNKFQQAMIHIYFFKLRQEEYENYIILNYIIYQLLTMLINFYLEGILPSILKIQQLQKQ